VLRYGMKPASIPKITLDTNCVIGLLDTKSETATSTEELRELVRLALSGKIELSITTRVEVDVERDNDSQRRASMLKQIAMFPVIGTVARWDTSKWDGEDIWVGPEEQALAEEVQRTVFPGLTPKSARYENKIADIDHLLGHKLSGRDIFVTDDSGILRRHAELRASFGIVVMKPAECLEFIDSYFSGLRVKALALVRDDAAYRDRRLEGTATFDYSNNDHRFTIGEGLYMFETRWSKASDRSIHAYRDSPSIDAIALAKGAKEIRDITDAAAYDFSSRFRSPQIGQIVIWRYVNGLYAATKITAIRDDTRDAEADQLSFEYVILPDGAADFSR
jgi:hypothetical protein